MPTMGFDLGEWMPDAPTFQNPGCIVAENVIPTVGGYGPMASPVPTMTVVSAPVTGARQSFLDNGEGVIIGGTASSLFVQTHIVTETPGYTKPTIGWDFCRFNRFAIATDGNNAPQWLENINTDTAWVDLPGNPPQADWCADVGEFVMLGGISGNPTRIQWSSYNNPGSDWTPSRLTQAGFADLDFDLGRIRRIVGGRFGLVFQERGVQRLSYVGPPTVWRADIVSRDRGCVAPFSVVDIGAQVFFLAQDGFYVTDGNAFQPVGTRRINSWFFENVEQASIEQTVGAVDWPNETIVWSFIPKGGGKRSRLLIYSWSENRWSTATVENDWPVTTSSPRTTLEQLDALYGGLENVPYSLDAPEFKASGRRLAVYQNGTFARLNGDPLTATWETGEFQPKAGHKVFVSEVKPTIDAARANQLVTLISRDDLGKEREGFAARVGWGGFAPVRSEGASMRVRLTQPTTTWENAQGMQVTFRVGGRR